MQYLAEVKKSVSMLGGARVEVRLLARNVSENNWQAINNDETLTVQDSRQAQDLKDGQLVLADVSNNKQVQSLQDASKRIVLILQSFSRLEAKYKQGEEDIEQWKQSLNYQSQELHRREVELEEKEQEFEQIEFKRQEIETAHQELQRERENFERWCQEFEAQKTNFAAHAVSLNNEQLDRLRELTHRILNSLNDPDSLQHYLSSSLDILYQRQEMLTGFWQELDAQQQQAQQQQIRLNTAIQELSDRKQLYQQTQTVFSEAQAELATQKGILKLQENNAAMIRLQIESQEELIQQTSHIIESYGGSSEILDPEEVKRLEEMPLEELEVSMANWQSEFDRMANYVHQQEEELSALEGEIANLQNQIAQTQEFERVIEIESNKELAEEQYKYLDEALVGQRRGLKERLSILAQQRTILERRKGMDVPDNPMQSLVPLLIQLEVQKSRLEAELQKLETQMNGVREIVQQEQDLFSNQLNESQRQLQELQAMETQLQEEIRVVAEISGRINAREQILQPLQDTVDLLRQNLETISGKIASSQSALEQQQLVADLQQVIDSLMAQ